MDSTAATTALTAVAAAGAWQGIALWCSAGDPVPYYSDNSQSPKELLRDWRRMFPPAKGMQAKLCVLGAVAAGTTAWGLRDSHPDVATAFGVTFACNCGIFGYTMAKIMPLNNRLLPEGEVEKSESEEGIRGMLQEWGRMHGMRTILGAVALGAACYGTHCLLTSK